MLVLPGKYVVSFTNLMNISILGTIHRLGTADLVVQVYDVTGTVLTAQDYGALTIDTTIFDVLLTFQQALTGRVVLIG